MIIDWPQELILDIARRRSVLFLGAGISQNAVSSSGARPKMWPDLLLAAIDQLGGSNAFKGRIRKLLRDKDYLTACEVIRSSMGEPAFGSFLKSELLDPQFQAAPIHDGIIELDSRLTATPNFDKIYESRVNHLQHSSVAVKSYYEDDLAEAIRGTGHVVMKVHGSIDKPSELIFTRTDYAKARNKHPSFYTILEALSITHTFLFLGCGLEDPDIRLVLEDYAFKHGFGRPHYFVLPKASNRAADIRRAIETSLNVRVLVYDPANNHALLAQAIAELVSEVNAERTSLATSMHW